MAAPTYLSGAKIPYHFSTTRSLCSRQQLNVGSFRGSCTTVQGPVTSRRKGDMVFCNAQKVDVLTRNESNSQASEEISKKLSYVMKFGGSSVASAERMKEVADLILSFLKESLVIVLSAMGKTSHKLLVAGEKAASCVSVVSEIEELSFVKELHYRSKS